MVKKIIYIIIFILLLFPGIFARAVYELHDGDLWCLSHYLRLKQAIVRYEVIKKKGGWPSIPHGSTLQQGDSGSRVKALINRLKITGDLENNYQFYDGKFTEEVKEAVKRFQVRHGLKDDGIVGYRTLQELNIPVSERIAQMKINLRRIRELSETIQESFVFINIPEYRLKVFDKGKEVQNIRVVIGREESPTPVFNDEIEYLVFNPPWNIPPEKVIKDILPEMKEDLLYLKRNNIKVFENWQEGANEIKPENIDWEKLYTGNLNYKFQQQPGPFNEMGSVKFIFPNKYFVYIHDTPHRHLFGYRKRTFSSGCIRIERPVTLAEYCLKQNGWGISEIVEVLENGQRHQIDLIEPVPVYIVYWTSWVSKEGIVNFRNDIYSKDKL